jgi:hypothetical protein
MVDVVCRHWRLFLLLSAILVSPIYGQTPTLTTITDTVYYADGTPAEGTLLISWPAFTTAAGNAVAAGSESVTLGPGGALSVALAPTQNAQPPNTVYTVVYQLNDLVKTEYWSVPAATTADLAEIRTTLGASASVTQMATQQFVNSALATKANDSAVVHLAGSETITGVKQFSVSPSFPTPVQSTDAANKAYVDTAVQTTGSGSYVSTSGGTMTGPLNLSADPVSANQAADKHYVDLWAAAKADLIGGYVPAAELASGTPSQSTCLLGNQTWGPCASGGSSSSYINSNLIANPNFNSNTPSPQNNALNCTFQNSGSNVSLQCPYGNSSTSFALGSQAVLNNQANTYAAGLQDFSQASLRLPSGPGYAPAVNGAIGFDTTANMPVVSVNNVTQQLALTTSNISGQAATAAALATTPSQCSGAFATGIQANGNANCSTAGVIQLSETTQPAGIPNYGIFWFDSSTHTPRIIDNNGQVEQLALLNVFNSDANTLEEYNGTTPQTLNVYGTRADASDYERLRLGYDTTDGYFLLGADAAGTGTQRGLGFWLQGSLRWVVDSAFNLKPWSDNVKDVGQPTLRLKHVYLGTYADLTSGGLVTELPNQAVTGTTLNKLAKVTGSPSTAIVASTTDNAVIGVVIDGAGTTGNAQIARDGQAGCMFDGPTTAGDYVQISSAIGGDCHDAGATYPGSGQVLGRVLSTNSAAGTYAMLVSGPDLQAPSQGAVSSIFGRTGSITAQSGDYNVTQITGAAPLASPIFTGTPTGPSPAWGDNSNSLATTAWVDSQSLDPAVLRADTGFSGADACAKMLAATTQAASTGQAVNARGFSGIQACSVNPIYSGFHGVLWLGYATFWAQQAWVKPQRMKIIGMGEPGGNTGNLDQTGTAIAACNPSGPSGTVTQCNGATFSSTDASRGFAPMICEISCSAPGSKSFNATVSGLSIDCNGLASCIGYQNGDPRLSGTTSNGAQENSGLHFVKIIGWYNGGRAIATYPGSNNSDYSNLNLNNEGSNLACSNAAVAVLVDFSAVATPPNGPKRFSTITVTNGGCATQANEPNDGIQVNASGVNVANVHCETLARACVNVSATMGATGIQIDSVNGSNFPGTAPDVVRITNTAGTAHILMTAISTGGTTAYPLNILNDLFDNVAYSHTAYPTGFSRYDTDAGIGGPFPAFWSIPGSVSTSSPVACSSTSGKATIWGVSIPFPIKTSNVTYYVVAADSTANAYDLGLYSASGTQVAHTGSLAGTAFAPTASHYTSQPWSSSNIVLQPGNYWLALSCSATTSTATLGYAYTWTNAGGTSESVTTGGTLPPSLTVPGTNSFSNAIVPQLVIY